MIRKHGAYSALSLATLALTINFWAWSLLSPLGVKIASELTLSPTMLALLLAIPVIIGSLGRIIVGMLTDKFGGKVMFSTLCLITSIPVYSLIFANDYNQLLITALLLGLGGAVFAIGIPFVSAWFPPEHRGLVLGIYSVGNAGTALSGFATPRLESAFGRNIAFITVATLLILMAVTFAVWAKNAPGWKPAKGSPVERITIAIKLRLTWDLSTVYVVTFGAFVAFGVYLPVLLKVSYDLSLTDAAARAAGFVLIATAARPFGGWLSDRIGAKNVIQVALCGVVLLAAFIAFQPTLKIQTTIAYLLLAFVLGSANGAVFALVGKLSKPGTIGSITGIVGAAGGLGGFLPPLLLGFTYQQTHSYYLGLILLSTTALATLLYINRRFKDKNLYGTV